MAGKEPLRTPQGSNPSFPKTMKSLLTREIIDKILIYLNDAKTIVGLGRLYLLTYTTPSITNLQFAKDLDHPGYLLFLIKKYGDYKRSLQIAAYLNNIQALRIWDNYIEPMRFLGLIDYAAAGGHLELIKQLDKAGSNATTNAMDWAASRGFVEIVVWLDAHRSEGCTQKAMDMAALNGHLKVVKCLFYLKEMECSSDTLNKAIKAGNMEMIQFLIDKCDTKVVFSNLHYACKHRKVEIFKHLFSKQKVTSGGIENLIEVAKIAKCKELVDWIRAK